MKAPKPDRNFFWLLIALSLLSLGRFLYIGSIPLSPDEAYYWSWSRKLSICYYDQPGMIAWVNYLSGILFDEPTAFSVRFSAVIALFFSSVFAYLAYKEISGNSKEAFLFSLVFNFVPIYFLAGLTMIHDTVLIFFLSGFYYFCFRLVARSEKWTVVPAFIFLLFALLTKFSSLMVLGCFGFYILLSNRARILLKHPYLYIGAFIVVIGFIPVLLWNYNHDWVSYFAVKALTKTKELTIKHRFSYFLNYVASQFGVYSPLIFIGMISALFKGIKEFIKTKDDTLLSLLTLSLPILVYFIAQSFCSHVFGNWSLVGYFPLLILWFRDSMQAIKIRRDSFLFSRRYFINAILVSFFMCAILAIEAKFRLFSPKIENLVQKIGFELNIDRRLDEELEGFEELAIQLNSYRKKGDFILARRYQIASVLEFYLADHPSVMAFSGSHRHSQFNLWTNLESLKEREGIYVDVKRADDELRKHFRSVEELPSLIIFRDSKKVKKFYFYRVRGYF